MYIKNTHIKLSEKCKIDLMKIFELRKTFDILLI